MLDNLPAFVLNFLRDRDDESSLVNDDDIAIEGNIITQINVVLSSDATMASEFPVKVNDCTITCPLDTGVSHSCMSYKCFESAFHTGQLQEIQCIKVENASGKSMEPIGLCEATVTLGPKDFLHTFIVCKELTSSVILDLDFSSQFLIGTDWTKNRTMYLHQDKHKLIEGTVTSEFTSDV